MNVVFVEPSFPSNQREFPRALAEVGATVIGIGETPKEGLTDDLKRYLTHYEQIGNVCDEEAMLHTVRRIQEMADVDRIEATVEAHILPVAKVREACGIPGTSVRTAWLCRDKPSMKEALRDGGIPCGASAGASSGDEARRFATETGYPIIMKPRDGAGAAGTYRIENDAELEEAILASSLDGKGSAAVEEFVEGHEAFYDTITIDGAVAHDLISHYYPNVLEAMRTRWISPRFVATNRIDSASDYAEVREMGQKVIEILGVETSATHMEWFYGPKGLRFAEIGCRPPGVGAWDLYCAANEFDIYREWAMAIVHGRTDRKPSRRYAAGIIALRPDRDGTIGGYEGLDAIRERYGREMIDCHLPGPGTATQGVEAGYMANAWMRFRHTDYDALLKLLDDVGETVQVRAE